MTFEIIFWHWLALSALLLIIELLAPGMFFLWMAEAAAVTGVLLLLFPALSWENQVLAFSVLSIVSIVVFRKYLRRNPIESDRPLLNERTAQFVGRMYVLDQPIVNGHGRLRIDDSFWKIQGEDCPVGTRVKIINADGMVLNVEIERPHSDG